MLVLGLGQVLMALVYIPLKKNTTYIHVASDCKVIIDDIKQGSAARYDAIIRVIIDRCIGFTMCNFIHEFRSLNVEAHNLANHALSLGVGLHIWLGQRRSLSFIPVNIVTA
jgi:hypothetical protein